MRSYPSRIKTVKDFPDSSLLVQLNAAFTTSPSLSSILHGKRKIIEGQRGRRTSLFPSKKCGGHIPLESQLELAHAISLESNRDVKDYRTQAVKIRLPGGAYAVPDFAIRKINDDWEIHEVKPDSRYLTEKCLLRFNQMEIIAKQNNVGFRIIDSRDLPDTKEMDRMIWLYNRSHARKYTHMEISLARELLEEADSPKHARSILLENDLPAYLFDYLAFHQLLDSNASTRGVRNDE